MQINDPNILGIERISSRSIETIEEALVCLASSQPVYGMTVENSNVRPDAEAGACRVGRVPQGQLVQVSAIYESDGDEPLITMDGGAGPNLEGSPIGYEDDIKPIVDRACTVCHSGIVQTMGLQVTEYEPLMAGSDNGPVIVPGKLDESLLWEMVSTRQMPMVGELSELDRETIRLWIEAGAPERRSALPGVESLWLAIDAQTVDEVDNACDGGLEGADNLLVSAELILPMNCGSPPDPAAVEAMVAALESGKDPVAAANPASDPGDSSAAAAPAKPNVQGVSASSVGIQVPSLGLPAPTDDDGWMNMRGDFCVEQRLPDNDRSITAITFAPDGRMFLALDSSPAVDVDPLVLYDAFHPSRSIAVYDYANDTRLQEIFNESPRITGLDYANGALYVTRSGEVGYIPDGGEYEPLAGGFAVQSQLFHANNGIVVHNGYVYVSAGGIIDGYSDGPIVGIPESAAQHIASGGNPYSARIVRAPLDRLLSERSINVFETAATGVRNPYGIALDPAGRIWFTDNGATNLPDDVVAGDEVNMLNPSSITGSDDTAPYYGFPLALNGNEPDWYVNSVVDLVNASAPTGITWAYNTIFFGQYGKDPGLYRLGRNNDGKVVAERLMVSWPLLAVATAPDGAVWIGTGNGGLFRITPGCAK